jgi:hypothetical protein
MYWSVGDERWVLHVDSDDGLFPPKLSLSPPVPGSLILGLAPELSINYLALLHFWGRTNVRRPWHIFSFGSSCACEIRM